MLVEDLGAGTVGIDWAAFVSERMSGWMVDKKIILGRARMFDIYIYIYNTKTYLENLLR